MQLSLIDVADRHVAASVSPMTLHSGKDGVGVRELHDRLSEYLDRVERGDEFIVTRRGRAVARLSGVEGKNPFEDLERRGLIRWPKSPRAPHSARIEATGPVSDLVHEQRR